jgi:thiamine biosynthesis lipoprotein
MSGTRRKAIMQLTQHKAYFSYDFRAMASPCQVLVESQDDALAKQLCEIIHKEVARIEAKFSRYLAGNMCHQINSANGDAISIDEECFRLLSFADTCYQLSDGMFDISSGVLRRAWTFDGGDTLPTQDEIDPLLALTGWHKVKFDLNTVRMAPDMELDFGGIGKEYAASSAAELCRKKYPDISVLINLGGDIQITRARHDKQAWYVGIENSTDLIPIIEGALATSGDAKRFLYKDGERYSHILNPKSGWPIKGAPASVTTHSSLCIQAGMLATLALLNGENAESFLKDQNVQHWITRTYSSN